MDLASIHGWISFSCIKEILRMIYDKVMENCLKMAKNSIRESGLQGK